jgi:hypothetical protein
MIFHSANNLRKEIKRKRKRKERKRQKKRKKKKKKTGHKRISIRAPCNNSDLVHTFQAWPSSFKLMLIGIVNKLG